MTSLLDRLRRHAGARHVRRGGMTVVVAVRADRVRYLEECLESLTDPGQAPAEVLLVPYGDSPVPLPPSSAAGPVPVRVLEPVADLDGARAAGLAVARGRVTGFLAPTDTALPGYADRALAALGDAPAAWTPSERRGGPLALAATAPLRLSDAVFATASLRAAGWAHLPGSADAALVVLARLDRAASLGPDEDLSRAAWARWEGRDHALGFGFEPDLAAEVDGWLTGARAAWELVESSDPDTRSSWAERLLAGLDPHLARVEEFADSQWERVRSAVEQWEPALQADAIDRLGVWARGWLQLVRSADRSALAELVDERAHRPEDLRTQLEEHEGRPVVVAHLPTTQTHLTPAETPAWASLRRMTWQEGPAGGLVLALAAGIRHLDLAVHPPRVEVALVAAGTTVGRRHVLPGIPLLDSDAGRLSGLRYVDQRPGGCTALLAANLLATLEGAYDVEVTVRAGGLERPTRVTDAELRGSAGEPVLVGHEDRTLRAAYAPGEGLQVQVAPGVPAPPPAPVSGTVHDVRLELELAADGSSLPTLVVTGRGSGHRGRDLELAGSGLSLPLSTTWEGEEFRAVTDLRRTALGGGVGLLPPAAYRLRWSTSTPGDRGAPPGPELLADLPRELLHPGARLEVRRSPNGTTAVLVGAPLAASDRGPFAQQQLIDTYGRADERGITVDPGLVYFQSFTGVAPTDSPAAIHAELRRRAPHLRTIWGVADGSVPVPDGAEAVLLRSAEWYDVLARAGHVVMNIEVKGWFRLRAGQRLLQTFHGYPSKAMGLMAWRAKNMTPGRIRRNLARSRDTWSAILTPAPEMNRHYREQYAYEGPIIDVGYPRDDALVGPEADVRRAAARAALGLHDGQVAVLHAPTWRDDSARNHRVADGAGVLDPNELAAALGEPYVVLQRAHRFHPELTGSGDRVIDVSEHPEINDLILASDAAVLDYSSLRFDYALTGKPMVFCVPDLDTYTRGARGFLFPFAESAPGPLCSDLAEVVAELSDLEGLRATHAEQMTAFVERFHPLRDGRAAERVVEAFFGGSVLNDGAERP